ncbi:MAG: hypothetical protein J7513_05815 [Solirubrobacteraceae bacterium]|nr:hypothetical protein [Solirubrobacteraceae bacterium]
MDARSRHPARRPALLGLGLLALLAAGFAAYLVVGRGPRAIGGATQADVQWRVPRQATEERPFALRLDGGVDGHAAVRTTLRTNDPTAACPTDPPDDAPRRVLLDRKDPEQHLGRTIGTTQIFTTSASGPVRICGWLLASSGAGDGRVVARFDRPMRVEPAPATLEVSRRTRVRAGARFALRATSVTAGPKRQLLLLAVPREETPTTEQSGTTPATTPPPTDADRCRALRPGRRSPERPVRIEAAVTEGGATDRLRVRFPFLAVGSWMLCTQIREADDPEPEAVSTQVLDVAESRECLAAKAAIRDRRDDLRLIRHRREVLKARIRTSRREIRAASSDGQADARRRREATQTARLHAYEVGTKAISQLLDRVTDGARIYCPHL